MYDIWEPFNGSHYIRYFYTFLAVPAKVIILHSSKNHLMCDKMFDGTPASHQTRQRDKMWAGAKEIFF